MTLRRKTLAVAAVALVCLVALLYMLQRVFVVRTLELVESRDAQLNIQRALRAVEREVRELDLLTQDWAMRDDTRAFVQEGNPARIQSNLTNATLADLRLNLLLAMDQQDEIVFSRTLESSGAAISTPGSGLDDLQAQQALLEAVQARGAVSGIMLLRQGPILVAARPVLTGDALGTPSGTLVMGRWLDAQALDELSDVSQLSLRLERAQGTSLPADFVLAQAELASATTWVHALDGKVVCAYGRLDDIYGNAALILRADLPRQIYQSGMAAMPYLNWATVALVPLYCLGVLWLWEGRVLKRVRRLSAQVNCLGASGDLSARVTLDGRDELSQLAKHINAMLAQLERAGDVAQQRAAHMRALARAAEALLGSDGEIPYESFLAELGRVLSADRAYLFLRQRGPEQPLAVHLAAEWCQAGIAPGMNGGSQPCAGSCAEVERRRWLEVLSGGGVVNQLRSQLAPEEQVSMAQRDAQAVLVVPVTVDDTLEGFLGWDACRQARLWEAADVDSARVAAADLGQALNRRRDEMVQRAIYRISEAAHAVQNLQGLYAAIHGIVSELMPARNFYIALHGSQAEDALIEFPYFVDEYDAPPPPTKPGRGLTEYVLRTGQPLLADPARFEELVASGEVDSIGAPSIDWLGVPLKIADRTIGVLVVQTYTAGVRYGEQDERILVFVSEQVAMAIERKRNEDALKRSEETYRTLFETTGAATCIVEEDSTVSLANKQFEQLTGYALSEVEGKMKWTEFVADEDELQRMKAYHRARRQNTGCVAPPRDYEFRLLHRSGQPKNVLVTVGLIPGTRQSVASVLDITEHRRAEETQHRLEEQLRQSQKMSAVGLLAGGVAHDFNNLLTVVLGNAELALDKLLPGEPLHKEMSSIERAARRGAALTQQLLAFSRRQVLQSERLDLNEQLTSFSRLLERLLGVDIELKLHLAAGQMWVQGDAAALDQVWMNLAVNARDAMPEGGVLTIATDAVSVDEAFLRDHPAAPGEAAAGDGQARGSANVVRTLRPVAVGWYVCVTLEDSGVGMGAEVCSHLFEPFFTTKQIGKGTGLGLSVVYGIVQQHAGWIEVASEPGVGTRFQVYLPAAETQAQVAEGQDLLVEHPPC